jgi:6-phosphogluconolactonase
MSGPEPSAWPPTLVFHAHPSVDAWTSSITRVVSGALREHLDQPSKRPRLLVSGGSTPAPVFRALSQAPLDWSRIDIALVDERWLPPGDPDSNARLVTDNLLRNKAKGARFEPLVRANRSIETAVQDANLHAQNPADVVLLGMGDDGHTASLFPHMRDLKSALASTRPYVPVNAAGCPGAGAWARRISLTPAGLARASTRLLLIRGKEKRDVLERAAGGTDPADCPVRIAFTTPGAVLQVHWCD